MSKITYALLTFTANGTLTQKQRVKVTSASSTVPIQVEAAGAGEQSIGNVERGVASGKHVVVRLQTWGGSLEGITSEGLAVGATLYGAAAGQIKDSSDGSAIGVALEAASGADEMIEYAPFAVLSTTAGVVSFADGAGATSAATVEAALAELYANILSAENFIGIPLNIWREAANFDVLDVAGNGGILASDTTPVLEAINDATDGCQRFVWTSSNNDQIVTSIPLPPNLDVAKDLILHTRIRSDTNASDAVGFTVDTFFNEGDSKVIDTSETNQTDGWLEKITTIANGDVPAGAQTMTIGLTPVAHTTDAMEMSSSWLEYNATRLT